MTARPAVRVSKNACVRVRVSAHASRMMIATHQSLAPGRGLFWQASRNLPVVDALVVTHHLRTRAGLLQGCCRVVTGLLQGCCSIYPAAHPRVQCICRLLGPELDVGLGGGTRTKRCLCWKAVFFTCATRAMLTCTVSPRVPNDHTHTIVKSLPPLPGGPDERMLACAFPSHSMKTVDMAQKP
jgi:hypothetical protein